MLFFTTLLLDRDGTLIRDRHYLADPDKVELLPGVAEALAGLARQGVHLYLVSNQSGIGRGLFPQEAAMACNARLGRLLALHGVYFVDMLFCPHAPEEKCGCRKPATGMWIELREHHGLVPEQTIMVGDKEEDMLFAANAGLAGRVLTLTGKGLATARHLGIDPLENELLLKSPVAAFSACPHLLIPSFHFLARGLALLSEKRSRACNA